MSAAVDREILALEDDLTSATREADVDRLDRLYADDIIFTGITGVICDKSAVMDEARRGRAQRAAGAASPTAPVVVGYEKDDIRAVQHGDTAVTSYRFAVTIRADGKEVIRSYRTTNVWMKRGETWQVVAAQTAALA